MCSLRCAGHEENDVEQDECVCTVACKGVQTHSIAKDNENIEYDLGIKYCPGIEPVLPVYTHMEFKPTMSTGRFTIFKMSTPATVLEERTERETVGGRRNRQSGRRGDRAGQ